MLYTKYIIYIKIVTSIISKALASWNNTSTTMTLAQQQKQNQSHSKIAQFDLSLTLSLSLSLSLFLNITFLLPEKKRFSILYPNFAQLITRSIFANISAQFAQRPLCLAFFSSCVHKYFKHHTHGEKIAPTKTNVITNSHVKYCHMLISTGSRRLKICCFT